MFEATTFNWKGRDFTIPPDRIMGAIATVEDVITLGEIADYSQSHKINLSRVAKAYAAVLRYAGAEASWEEVYKGMFGGGQTTALVAVRTLLLMMIPPGALDAKEVGSPPSGKNRAERRSSKSPTKRRSA